MARDYERAVITKLFSLAERSARCSRRDRTACPPLFVLTETARSGRPLRLPSGSFRDRFALRLAPRGQEHLYMDRSLPPGWRRPHLLGRGWQRIRASRRWLVIWPVLTAFNFTTATR